MASIAEILISGVQESTKESGRQAQASIESAAQLALKQEALKQQKAEVAQKKEDLKSVKLDSFFRSFEKGANYSGKARKNYYEKYMPQVATSLGISPDTVSPLVFEGMVENPEISRIIQEARIQLREGKKMPDGSIKKMSISEIGQAIKDPELWSEVSSILLADAQERDRSTLAQARLQSTQERFEETEKRRSKERFTTVTTNLRKEAESNLKDLNAIKVGIGTSDELLKGLQEKIRKGESLNSSQRAKLGVAIEPIVRGIGQAKGPLSDEDVSRILGRHGIVGTFQEFTQKFITGTPDAEQIAAFREIIDIGAKRIDQEVSARVGQLRKSFSTPEFAGREKEIEEIVGLKRFERPTLQKQKKKDLLQGFDRNKLKASLESGQKGIEKILKQIADKAGTTVEAIKKELE